MDNEDIIELPEADVDISGPAEVQDNTFFALYDDETKTLSVSATNLTKERAQLLLTVLLDLIPAM